MFKIMITRLMDEDGASVNDDSEPSSGDGSRAFRADGSRPEEADTAKTPASEAEPAERNVGLDDVFGILRNRRRRDVLRYLDTEADHVEVGPMAVEIAARECDKPSEDITSQERKRVYVALYQSHLPKMDDIGAIDYDSRSGDMEPGPAFDAFLRHLPAEE